MPVTIRLSNEETTLVARSLALLSDFATDAATQTAIVDLLTRLAPPQTAWMTAYAAAHHFNVTVAALRNAYQTSRVPFYRTGEGHNTRVFINTQSEDFQSWLAVYRARPAPPHNPDEARAQFIKAVKGQTP